MNVLIERKLDIPVFEFRYSDVLDKAHEMIQSGTKIIISRGGTAALLRSNITIPVIEIAHISMAFIASYRKPTANRKKLPPLVSRSFVAPYAITKT